jgi:hypothetical protein
MWSGFSGEDVRGVAPTRTVYSLEIPRALDCLASSEYVNVRTTKFRSFSNPVIDNIGLTSSILAVLRWPLVEYHCQTTCHEQTTP